MGKLLKFAAPSDFADHQQQVDLAPVVRDCLVLVDHLISQHQITVTCQFDPVPPVRVDTGEIQQVIVNLVVNAVQAMGDGGN